jgi:hypothetical protein
VSSDYIQAKDEPSPDEIVEALQEAIFENPRLREMLAEEVARQLVLVGCHQQDPSPVCWWRRCWTRWRSRRRVSRPMSSPRRVTRHECGTHWVADNHS